MIDPQMIADNYAISLRNLHLQTNGLSHADSLLQLPFRGNCMNWTLGHLLLCREELFDILGAPRVFPPETFTRYDSGTEPITADAPDVIRIETLLEMLDQQAVPFTTLIANTSEETYASTIQVGKNTRKIAQRVLFYFFHEANHVGELGLLRQLAGKDDKII